MHKGRVDNISLTLRVPPPLSPEKKKERKMFLKKRSDLIHDELEIGNELVQYICFLMYRWEFLQACGMSNFGHVSYYMAPTKGG